MVPVKSTHGARLSYPQSSHRFHFGVLNENFWTGILFGNRNVLLPKQFDLFLHPPFGFVKTSSPHYKAGWKSQHQASYARVVLAISWGVVRPFFTLLIPSWRSVVIPFLSMKSFKVAGLAPFTINW